jgi:hypothetical protein
MRMVLHAQGNAERFGCQDGEIRPPLPWLPMACDHAAGLKMLHRPTLELSGGRTSRIASSRSHDGRLVAPARHSA